jgi:hypothetical protein
MRPPSIFFSIISFIQITMVNLITKVHLSHHFDVVIIKQLSVMYAKLEQLFGINIDFENKVKLTRFV